MNRRDFLSFAAVAPVALPMAAKAMVAESSGIYIGIDWASEADRLGVAYMRKTLDGWASISPENLKTLASHPDLFKLDFMVIGESVPQTERSPERQKEERVS